MKKCIKINFNYFNELIEKIIKNLGKKQKQYIWFVILWIFGFLSISVISYLIRKIIIG